MTNTDVTNLFAATEDIYNTIDEILSATDKWDYEFLMSWYDNM